MTLQVKQARAVCFWMLAGGSLRQFQVIMNHNPIMANRNTGILGFLTALVNSCREIVVIGLPGQGRKTHINLRLGNGINPAALIVLSFQSKRIQDLDLVPSLDIHCLLYTSDAADE